MAIALITSETRTVDNDNVANTAAMNTTGSDLLVAGMVSGRYGSGGTADIPAAADSESNTWTAGDSSAANEDFRIKAAFAYCLAPTVSASHTIVASATTHDVEVAATAFSGVLDYGGPSDGAAGGAGSTSVTDTTITPDVDGCLIVSVLAWISESGDAAVSIDSGFTILEQQATTLDLVAVAIAYKIQTTAATESPTWTHPNSNFSGGGDMAGSAVITGWWRPAAGSSIVPILNSYRQRRN